eukprot:3350063-Pleurochrysis_carterae.AAC.1
MSRCHPSPKPALDLIPRPRQPHPDHLSRHAGCVRGPSFFREFHATPEWAIAAAVPTSTGIPPSLSCPSRFS